MKKAIDGGVTLHVRESTGEPIKPICAVRPIYLMLRIENDCQIQYWSKDGFLWIKGLPDDSVWNEIKR